MFLSYECSKDLDYDKATGKYRYQYKIIDTDFEEVWTEVSIGVRFDNAFGLGDEVAAAASIVETYRKRNLPVVPNLILYWQNLCKKYDYSLEEQIGWFKQYNPYYSEYKNEINKYLLLL